MLSSDALRKKLKAFCKGKTQAAAATKLGVTAAQLSRALSGAAPVIPARIVRKLGYQAVIAYVPKGRTATKSVKVARDASTGRVVSKAAAKKNPKGTVVETQQRAVKPAAKNAPKKSTAQKNREYRSIVGKPASSLQRVAAQVMPESRTDRAEDLVRMIDKGPIIATIPTTEDTVIDLSKKD